MNSGRHGSGAGSDRWLSTLAGPTIKAALFLGFGMICATWLLAGFYFARRMSDLQSRSASVNERYTRAQELLTSVRGQVLVGSVNVRDALLDPDSRNIDEYRRKLEDAYRAADRSLVEYVPIVDGPAERQRIARLHAELGEFRQALLSVLATDSTRWPLDARMLLRQQILPRREAAIRVADDVQSLNRGEFLQQLSDVASIYRTTQRELWGSFGLAVIVSLAIAWLATIYAGRLETRIHLQHLREGEYVRDLQRLSTKLITAQEEERRAIARELHDEVGQGLTAIKVELTIAQRAIELGASGHVLDDARSIAEHALHAVRDLSHLLHPALLDDLGLAAAVDWYVNGFGTRHGISVELVQDRMTGRLRQDVEVTAYRIVQEALTNVAKHSGASSCRVCLRRLPRTMVVTVDDDGVGFGSEPPREDTSAQGLGLIGIRERASQLGGMLRLESGAGKGTRLTVELPAEPRTDRTTEPEPSAVGFTALVREALGG